MAIKVVKERMHDGVLIHVYPWGSRAGGEITVTRRKRYGSKLLGPAEINWFAAGAQKVGYTKTFLRALTKAVAIARRV